MNPAQSDPDRHTFRVAVCDAHLEYLVDGSGDWFATLKGVIERSGHEAVPTDIPIAVRLGDYDPQVLGFHGSPTLASATASPEGRGMAALKALLAQVREDGPSLRLTLNVNGEPKVRGRAPGHIWEMCSVIPHLNSTPGPADLELEMPDEPDFDGDLRIIVKPIDFIAETRTRGYRARGIIHRSRRPSMPEGMAFNLKLRPDLAASFIHGESACSAAWPLRGSDDDSLLDLIELAERDALFIDLDLSSEPAVDNPARWYITDLGVIAPSLLKSRTPLLD